MKKFNVDYMIGFECLKPANLAAAFSWMEEEGTCCLAYGDWTAKGYNLLLTKEQQDFHKNQNEADLELWDKLDDEIAEAMIMLPVMRNIASKSLFWDGNGHIATETFVGARYGLTVIEHIPDTQKIFTSFEELGEYCANNCVDRTLSVAVTLRRSEVTQNFTWTVASALDFNMLEEAVCSAANLAHDEEGETLSCSFTVA